MKRPPGLPAILNQLLRLDALKRLNIVRQG